jgi:hypothetical protein
MSTILKKRYKSPNPALNVRPRDEPVATDTIYSDTPANDCGVTSAHWKQGLEHSLLQHNRQGDVSSTCP